MRLALIAILLLALCGEAIARCEHDSPELSTDACKGVRETEIMIMFERMHTPATQADIDKLRAEIAELKKLIEKRERP